MVNFGVDGDGFGVRIVDCVICLMVVWVLFYFGFSMEEFKRFVQNLLK